MKIKMALNDRHDLIDMEVVYSKRSTMAIKICAEGNIKVFVPQGTHQSAIDNMIRSKADWIHKNLNAIRASQAMEVKRTYTDGEIFLYLGCDYPLQLKVDPRLDKIRVKLGDGRLEVSSPLANEAVIQDGMEAWYRFMATEYINDRLKCFQPLLDVCPNRVTIRGQKTRWGSCSSKGNLSFNWRLMMAPAEVVDYVIVHELCHLIHPNHAKSFWNQVSAILPDYKSHQVWLKKNGPRLMLGF